MSVMKKIREMRSYSREEKEILSRKKSKAVKNAGEDALLGDSPPYDDQYFYEETYDDKYT
jgi:hypothetical protein